MRYHIPPTPFSTPFSGSAKEAELRIRNIVSGPKKRPPLPLMLLAALVILSCGWLVSCQSQPAVPVIVMETQHYDDYGNYIEIPTLVMSDGSKPSGAITAMNQALAELRAQYPSDLDDPSGYAGSGLYTFDNRCLLYPSTTGRHLNLLFFRESFAVDTSAAHVLSLVYDLEEERQVTLEDALELAGVTEQELYSQLSEQMDATLLKDSLYYIQAPSLEGFRMGADGQPIFYLTALVDDDPDKDWISGGEHVFIWSEGTFTFCGTRQPLVPAEETDQLDPPLWSQRYAGEKSERGSDPAASGSSSQEVSPWGIHPGPVPDYGTLDQPVEPDIPIGGLDGAGMRNAYADVLENMVQNLVFPDGTVCDPLGDMTANLFSVYDVDGDGKEELVILYSTTYTAGWAGYVFAYDEASSQVRTQLLATPFLTFYGNGAVRAAATHNQGLGGAFWPYVLYQYQPDSDSYIQVGMVDGWDRGLSDENPDSLPPFPSELDVSGTGFLYYITAEGHDGSQPVDASVYNTWLDAYIGDGYEPQIPYLAATQENIQLLRSGA